MIFNLLCDSLSILYFTDEDGRDLVVQEKETTATQQDVSSEYWTSEHHRLEYGKSSNYICQHNPLSYHQVGLAVPGTFVDEGELSYKKGTFSYAFKLEVATFELCHEYI